MSTAPGPVKGPPPGATAEGIAFETFCSMLERLVRTPSKGGKKIQVLRRFCERHVPRRNGNDVFHFYRLLLPSSLVEKERGNYQLKEAKLASVLAGALGASSADTERAREWRSLDTAHSGIFHEVMYNVLYRKYLRPDQHLAGGGPGQLTLGEVNRQLDDLVLAAGNPAAQQGVLRRLLQRCSPGAAKWLTMILMRDLKIGMSAETVLLAYHPDGPDALNGCMDLRKVLCDLIDPSVRLKKRDVVPGQAAKPQLADRCDGGIGVAARRMRGRRFVVEVKFDGERMQVHRTGPETFNFFSRRGFDHGAKRDFGVLAPALAQLTTQEHLILDGEMVVWNKTRGVFEPFGGLTSAMDAINRGACEGEVIRGGTRGAVFSSDPNYEFPLARDIEVVYMAFDVLYIDGGSVLERPLRERHELLRRALSPCPPEGIPVGPTGTIRFRALTLLPGVPLLGGDVCSREGVAEEDISVMYEHALAKQEEGILVKALDSPYVLNDRSGSWLKVKPDYVDSTEFDTVVIGAMWGTGGRRGGRLSEFLLALAEAPRIPGAEPSTFVSFCRVGTGLDAAQYEVVRERLRPLLVELAPGQRPPRCYRVTGHARERPDLWVHGPLRSVVLTVKADVRTITSEVFASRYSLRFPRVCAIRDDKAPRDANTTAELERLVTEAAEGRTGRHDGVGRSHWSQKGGGGGGPRKWRGDGGGRGGGGGRGRRMGVAAVPLSLRPVDVSNVAVESEALHGRLVLLRDCEPAQRRQLAATIKRLGGTETQNFVPTGAARTSYVILGRWPAGGGAAAANGQPPQTADPWLTAVLARDAVDVLRPEWLLACGSAGQLPEPPRPSLAWHLCTPTREAHAHVMDPFGDPYFELLDAEDLAAVLGRHVRPAAVAEARAALEAAAAMPARARRRARQADARRQPDGRTTLYETADDLVRRVRHEMAAVGSKPPPGSMFLGLTLLFLEMQPIPPQPALPSGASTPLGLLEGVEDCQARAYGWVAAEPRDRVEALKAAVVRHGGVVVEAWNERVTHLVMYDGLDERDPRRRALAAEARRAAAAAAAAAAASGAAPGGAQAAAAGALGLGADAAALDVGPQFSPEEVIEALIGVAESAADEDAAEDEEADEDAEDTGRTAEATATTQGAAAEARRAGSAIGTGGEGASSSLVAWASSAAAAAAPGAHRSGGGGGGASALAAAVRRLSPAQRRCLSLIRAALERPPGVVEAVGAVQLVDWRWVRDSLDRAAAAAAAAQRAAAAAAAARGSAGEAEDAAAADEEEAKAEAAAWGAVGHLSELDYPARVRPPSEWLQTQPPEQQQQQQEGCKAAAAGGDEARERAAAAAQAYGAGGQAGPTTTGAPLPRSIASVWLMLDGSDSEDHATAPPVTAPPAAAASPAATDATASAHGTGGGGGGDGDARGLAAPPGGGVAAAGVLRGSQSQPLAPPPDELIRLWPWERYNIGLPASEELAALGTHHRRRRHRDSDGGPRTSSATATSTGSDSTGGPGSGGGGGGGAGGRRSSRGRSASPVSRAAAAPRRLAPGTAAAAGAAVRPTRRCTRAAAAAAAPNTSATTTAAASRKRPASLAPPAAAPPGSAASPAPAVAAAATAAPSGFTPGQPGEPGSAQRSKRRRTRAEEAAVAASAAADREWLASEPESPQVQQQAQQRAQQRAQGGGAPHDGSSVAGGTSGAQRAGAAAAGALTARAGGAFAGVHEHPGQAPGAASAAAAASAPPAPPLAKRSLASLLRAPTAAEAASRQQPPPEASAAAPAVRTLAVATAAVPPALPATAVRGNAARAAEAGGSGALPASGMAAGGQGSGGAAGAARPPLGGDGWRGGGALGGGGGGGAAGLLARMLQDSDDDEEG